MIIKGLQKLTLLDYPGHTACTVFTGGCDMRCPFCHNAPLVLEPDSQPDIPAREVLAFLRKRQGLLDGVCVSGGEPLLQPDLADFLAQVKELGFRVKLDTNGSHPERLARLLEAGLPDYVAMDIKNSPSRYAETAGLPGLDIAPFKESAALLLAGSVDYEFRTTVCAGLHGRSELADIGRWLAGAKAYYIQPFRDSGDLVGQGCQAPTEAELADMLAAVRPFIPAAALRGVD